MCIVRADLNEICVFISVNTTTLRTVSEERGGLVGLLGLCVTYALFERNLAYLPRLMSTILRTVSEERGGLVGLLGLCAAYELI